MEELGGLEQTINHCWSLVIIIRLFSLVHYECCLNTLLGQSSANAACLFSQYEGRGIGPFTLQGQLLISNYRLSTSFHLQGNSYTRTSLVATITANAFKQKNSFAVSNCKKFTVFSSVRLVSGADGTSN